MQDQFNRLSQENEELQESISELVARANEAFWQPIGFAEDEGVELTKLQELSRRLRDQAATGSLHARAVQLTHAYVFGRGMLINYDDLQARIQKAIDHSS